jgi:mannan endo-1,4-beta-mannosidase
MASQSCTDRTRLSLALTLAFLASACAWPASTPAVTTRPSSYPSASSASFVPLSPSPTPCPRATSADAAKVLAYLRRLTDDTEYGGVISGHICGNVGGICNDDVWATDIEALHTSSGKWPGVLMVDYEYATEFAPAQLSAGNRRLIDHWQAGGLVMIGWSPANPWGSEPWAAWREIETRYPETDLRELLPGGAKRERWLASLDRIAGGLSELRDAGVVVLWRPMQEMNNPVYWWAKSDDALYDPHPTYGEVWRDMFDYFTYEKGLDNLLWAFAPIGTQAYSSFPYPGDAYVDVIAPTGGGNDLSIVGYDDYLAYGKPLGMSEYGPNAYGDDIEADGSFDDRLYIQRLRGDYPRVAFWCTPASWMDIKTSLADNLHARELMNDPDVITRDEIDWR